MKQDTTPPEIEVIKGQIVAKANNYQAVPDGHGGRRIIKNARIRKYEESFLRQCKKYAGRLIDRPFKLVVWVYHSRNVFDLDGSFKTLLDCLQYAGAITNDNLCKKIVAEKRINSENPRVEFAIIPDPKERTLFDELDEMFMD